MSSNAKSFEERAASAPTDLHKAFAEWLFVQTGIKPDLKTVQLACAFRMDFQKSEANQKDLAARKAAALAKKQKAAAEKRERLQKQLAKLQAELAETTEAPAAPVAKKATPKKAATPTPPAPAPTTEAPVKAVAPASRRRPAKKAVPAATAAK